MTLKVWKEGITDENKDQLYLKLNSWEGKNQIALQVCDVTGTLIKSGNIIVFDFDYKVAVTLDSINPIIPLKTDVIGELLVYKEKAIRDIERESFQSNIENHFMKELIDKNKSEEKVKH